MLGFWPFDNEPASLGTLKGLLNMSNAFAEIERLPGKADGFSDADAGAEDK